MEKRVVWHYFCRNAKSNEDKYIKYLLISLDSLINIGGVDPKDIFISLDIPENFTHECLDKIYSYNANILSAPIFKNHSKITNLRKIILGHRTADKIVQIDVDTLITDRDILSKILELDGFLNRTTIGWPISQAIKDRDGMRHPTFSAEYIEGTNKDHSRNLLFSVANEDGGKHCQIHRKERYAAFKHFMDVVFAFDVDAALGALSEEKRMMVGYLVVLNPKMITDDYLKFISTLDLFFSCDETIWSLAKVYSGIEFSDINKKDKIVHGAVDIHDFDKLKGIIHFPVKDEEIIDPINKMIDQILQK
jgi:hypothetical protein